MNGHKIVNNPYKFDLSFSRVISLNIRYSICLMIGVGSPAATRFISQSSVSLSHVSGFLNSLTDEYSGFTKMIFSPGSPASFRLLFTVLVVK